MEKRPSRGAKDWKGLRMKRPSLWTGPAGPFILFIWVLLLLFLGSLAFWGTEYPSLEVSGWLLSSALEEGRWKGEVQRSEVVRLNSWSWKS